MAEQEPAQLTEPVQVQVAVVQADQAVAQAEVDQAEAEVAQAEADLAVAQVDQAAAQADLAVVAPHHDHNNFLRNVFKNKREFSIMKTPFYFNGKS